ncbi:phage upper tail fiber protein [Nocardia sp. NPDC004722]
MTDVIIGVPPNIPTLGAAPSLPTGGVLVPVAGRDGHGIDLNGVKNAYTELPAGLGPDDNGRCYLVLDDNLVYFWNGAAWPAKGKGSPLRGDKGDPGRGIDAITATPTGLRFNMSATPTAVDVPIPALTVATDAAATATRKADESLINAGVAANAAGAADASAKAADATAKSASTASATAITSRDQAAASATAAATSARNAADSATAAAGSATAADTSRAGARTAADDATASANSASAARTDAQAARDTTRTDASAAADSKTKAGEHAATAKYWAEHASETVGSGIPNADKTIKGGIMLPGANPGELGGTFEHPAVVGWNTKADISALDGKYAKPAAGIPRTDLDTTVQGALDKAATAYQRPGSGILKADLESAVQTSLSRADSAVQVDGTGKIPAAMVPAIALTEFLGAVASQSAMLTLTGQRGDWCTRTDRGTDWQLIGEPSSQLSNWREATYPASPVSTVNGRTGTVTTGSADITDATTIGRAVITAASAAAARSTIGAGTSSLVVGTTGGTAAAGDDPRLSDQRTPLDGSITNAKIAAGAAIALSKLATGNVAGSDNSGARSLTIWVGSEAQFTAIATKDPNTIYMRTA